MLRGNGEIQKRGTHSLNPRTAREKGLVAYGQTLGVHPSYAPARGQSTSPRSAERSSPLRLSENLPARKGRIANATRVPAKPVPSKSANQNYRLKIKPTPSPPQRTCLRSPGTADRKCGVPADRLQRTATAAPEPVPTAGFGSVVTDFMTNP